MAETLTLVRVSEDHGLPQQHNAQSHHAQDIHLAEHVSLIQDAFTAHGELLVVDVTLILETTKIFAANQDAFTLIRAHTSLLQ